MVIMDHNTNITGSPTSSQVLSNGIQSIQTGLSNGIQSIQTLPPQVYILKERIVNKNNYSIMDDKDKNNINNNTLLPIGIRDYGDNYFEDNDNERSSSPSRLRSFSAPGSTGSVNNTAICTGTKNQRELFQQSIDTLAAKFNNSNIGSNKSPLKNSGGSGSGGSDNEQPSIKQGFKEYDDCYYESEELTNIDEEMIRMRSFSLTSVETIKKIQRERSLYSPREDVLSPYELMSHLEYQERLEKEEMERLDKNNVIISQSSYDGYTGNQVKYETESMSSCSSIKSSSSNIGPPQPSRITASYSNSFSGTPSSSNSMCLSPPPSRKGSNSNSHSLSGSLNGTNNLSSGISSPSLISSNSMTSRSSPLFKRSLTSNVPLSKSASRLPSIEQISQSPLPQQAQQQQPTILIQQVSSPSLQPKKVQPLVKSPSQNIFKQQSNTLSPNRPSTPVQNTSTPNLGSLKKLTNKLSLSTHSLPQSYSNSPIDSPSSPKLVKCPSGNSIHKKQQPQLNNSFQLELKQHLKMKQESNNNTLNITLNNGSNNIDNNISNNNGSKKERFEIKKSNLQKPIEEPSSFDNNKVKITFQFTSTGKKVNRYFNSDSKVQEIKNYIEWFAFQEPQLFNTSFKLSDESFYKIVDYEIEYTILPTKFLISNFDSTFKDSGFTPKSNLINISLV